MSYERNRRLFWWAGLLLAVLLCSGCIKVTATSPAKGATGVACDAVIQVTFSVNAKASTVTTETFLVEDSLGSAVSGTVAYANKVATFTPASDLALMRGYTVTLTKGIKDTSGFALSAQYSFDFTTGDGAWGTAQLIETSDIGTASNPQIAVDANGNAMAVWSQYDGTRWNIWSNRYTPASGWGTAQLIETDNAGYAYEPQIAVDATSNAVAVWYQYDGTRNSIYSNRYTMGSGWGTAQLIETDNTGNAYKPQVAADTSGNAVAVWYQYDGTRYSIYANRYTPGSGWDTAQLIETDNAGDTLDPQIAIDAAGNAMAIWCQSDGTRYNIWSNRYTSGGGWGTAQLIETDNAGHADRPQIAVDASGNAVAVWEQSDGTRYNIWSNRYTPGSGWGTAQLIETNNAGVAGYPQIAVDAYGNAVAVWCQYNGSQWNIWSNLYAPISGWGTAQLIETDNVGSIDTPQLAIDAEGNAMAVWKQSNGSQYNICANRYTRGSGWSTVQLIAVTGAWVGGTPHPQIAIGAKGNAVMVWEQFDGTRNNIMSNHFE